jgi:hypothetical protein
MCSYVVARNILGSIVNALSVAMLLDLAKPFGGIQPIIIGKILD